jgi:hypothetical protein
MRRSCAASQHVALWRPVRNQGFDFGRCRKCGRDLVRSRRAWRTVPEGFRVVWRRSPPGASDSSAAQLKLELHDERRMAAPGRRSRVAVAAELALLGVRGLASAMAERARLWLRARPAQQVAIAGALGPPAR